MIIFYNKNNGEILGDVKGRFYDDIDSINMTFSDVSNSDIVKYVIPFKEKTRFVKGIIDIKRFNLKTKRMGIEQVNFKKKVKIKELLPDVPFAELVLSIEGGKENLYKYKIDLKTKQLIK